ncbi:MAG: phage tail protein, partial [Bacteroidota bacterium]
MATDKATIVQDYPLPVYNYMVIIGENEVVSFSEVSGLMIDYDHLHYRHGMSWMTGDHLIRTQRKPINVTLRRGISQNRKYLFEWLQSADKRNIRIDLCNELLEPLVSWEVSKALPIKMDAPAFNASSSEVA